MNPYVRLPRAPLYSGRQDYVLRRCAGKRVLHVGCVDAGLLEQRYDSGELMHQRLASVAAELWGVDIDAAGIDFLRRHGFSNLHVSDASAIDQVSAIREARFDVVVASELIEHLSNPGLFLDSTRRLVADSDAELVVTVPNAFRVRSLLHLLRGVEYVHPDHNYWFSYHTITGLIRKHGYEVVEVAAYTFHPGGRRAAGPDGGSGPRNPSQTTKARHLRRTVLDAAAHVVFPLVYRTTPFWGDGIIVVARAQG
jgi:hypothetical protein